MEIFIESPDVITQKVYYNWNAITVDPDDNKFFDIAVASDADYLVTNDRHFDKVKTITFPTVKVITSKEFLTVLTKR
jgi:predicted nucleic acid-binding protein